MANEPVSLKKVKRKIKNSQNPLFEKWLKEWKDEAAKNGSDMQYVFNRALKSIKKFPIKLYSGKECIMLENFGAKLCQKLDDRLQEYRASHPEDSSLYPKTYINSQNESLHKLSVTNIIANTRKTKSDRSPPINEKQKLIEKAVPNKRTKGSSFLPGYRTGSYAILITMFQKSQEDGYKGHLSKNEILMFAQDLCDASFTKPLPGSHYTAWSCMSALIRKKLVYKEGNPARFSLTEEGTNLAIKLIEADDKNKNIQEMLSPIKNKLPGDVKEKCASPVSKKSKPSSRQEPNPIYNQKEEHECASEADETIFLLPGSFDVILLVDTQERDEKHQQADMMTMRGLESRNVRFDIRHLKVGDFLWVARDLNNGHELVLPYIVERKRMDDLASSIKDGRFHEQKFRLRQSGVENLIYLVEKYGGENHRLGLPLPSLQQAISNTQVLNGFAVKVTNDYDHSMRYLDIMTTQLSDIFKTKTLISCKKSNLSSANLSDDLISLMTFKEFNKGSEKNKKLTVRNMLVKQLIQLSGVSLEKAQAITQLYPTPKALMEGLRTFGEKSIVDLTYGTFNRSIGPAIAKQLHMLYTSLVIQ